MALDGNANNRNPVSDAERATRERLGLGTSKVCSHCGGTYEYALSIQKNQHGEPVGCTHDFVKRT